MVASKPTLSLALDGPALTPDGVAVDVGEPGAALFFSFARELSPSHASKAEAKDDFRMFQAMQIAHAACESDALSPACSVDPFGVVHGDLLAEEEKWENGGDADRQKLLHRKKHSRTTNGAGNSLGVLALDVDGRVAGDPCHPAAIDIDGIVQARPGDVVASPKAGASERLKTFYKRRTSFFGDEEEDVFHVFSVDDSGSVASVTAVTASPPPIDSDGVVHTRLGCKLPPSSPKSPSAQRLKQFHRKQFPQVFDEPRILCVDDAGLVRSQQAPPDVADPLISQALMEAHWGSQDITLPQERFSYGWACQLSPAVACN